MRDVAPLSVSKVEEAGLRRLMAGGDKEDYKRCLAILLRARGTHPNDVAGMLGVTRRSVERWVKAYRAYGVYGLRREPRLRGRKPVITQEQKKIITEIALKSPTAFGYLKNEWSVRLLARHLTKELGIKISKTHVWEILHELGIVYKRPKAVVKSPDPDYEEKAAKLRGFKKVASALEKKGLQ